MNSRGGADAGARAILDRPAGAGCQTAASGTSPRLAGAVAHLIGASCLLGIGGRFWESAPDATFADLRHSIRQAWPGARLPEIVR